MSLDSLARKESGKDSVLKKVVPVQVRSSVYKNSNQHSEQLSPIFARLGAQNVHRQVKKVRVDAALGGVEQSANRDKSKKQSYQTAGGTAGGTINKGEISTKPDGMVLEGQQQQHKDFPIQIDPLESLPEEAVEHQEGGQSHANHAAEEELARAGSKFSKNSKLERDSKQSKNNQDQSMYFQPPSSSRQQLLKDPPADETLKVPVNPFAKTTTNQKASARHSLKVSATGTKRDSVSSALGANILSGSTRNIKPSENLTRLVPQHELKKSPVSKENHEDSKSVQLAEQEPPPVAMESKVKVLQTSSQHVIQTKHFKENKHMDSKKHIELEIESVLGPLEDEDLTRTLLRNASPSSRAIELAGESSRGYSKYRPEQLSSLPAPQLRDEAHEAYRRRFDTLSPNCKLLLQEHYAELLEEVLQGHNELPVLFYAAVLAFFCDGGKQHLHQLLLLANGAYRSDYSDRNYLLLDVYHRKLLRFERFLH